MTKKVLIDLLGQRFGRLQVVARAANTGPKKSMAVWCCVCDCGGTCDVLSSNLRAGKSTSCGCTRRVHGRWKVPEYSVWRAMVQRCCNPNSPAYKNYGGRGIVVCEAWREFASFYADMGSRPSPDHSLERKDNDAGYSPDNCVWATRQEQGQNRRTSVVTDALATAVRASDEPQKVLAARYGVSQATISRIRTNKVWPSQKVTRS
jgi:hypothetical protein